ncbi:MULTISPECIES: hypothetical protein [Photorhabdus]|uniref:Uncharacterized protein n=2 Tax=Photorhabdus asymbiotica TaxID=291112 RepID=C7BTU2_PHOAA|nr:hypothetical protein [Photorhabdus asymbiotica]RKS59552.1 hypothetical protein BDD30_1628 [Photorhabdus asymbiotica]CAQ85191.1 hypothetical protein PAU_03103 [Photorhabdus asymbiotica]
MTSIAINETYNTINAFLAEGILLTGSLSGVILPLRGVRTSSKRTKPTPLALDFLCLSFSGRNTRPHSDQGREGDEYNTRKGNKSAALTAVLNLPAPYRNMVN